MRGDIVISWFSVAYSFALSDAIVNDGVISGRGHKASGALRHLQFAIFQDDSSARDDDQGHAVDFHAFEDVEIASVVMRFLRSKCIFVRLISRG